MITIGILVSNKSSKLTKIVLNYLKQRGKDVCLIEKVEETYLSKNRKNLDYIIYEILLEDVESEKYKEISFDILLEGLLEKSYNKIEYLQDLVFSIKGNGYFIFNSDYINKINFRCNDLYPVTYGLNGKTTVTASSINDLNLLEFSLCLQRTILTMDRDITQPFEVPIKVEGKASDLNYYIAALTLIIILGYKF